MNYTQNMYNLKQLRLLLMAALICTLPMSASDSPYPGLSERIKQFNMALQKEDIVAISSFTVAKDQGVFFPMYYYSRLGMERWQVLRIFGIMSEKVRHSEERLPYEKVLVVTRLEDSARDSDSLRQSVVVDYWFFESSQWRVVPIEIVLSNVNFEFDTDFLQYFIQTPEQAADRYKDYLESKETMQKVRDNAVRDEIQRHLDSRTGSQ